MTKTGGEDINCFQISASLKRLEISTLAKPRGRGTLKLRKKGGGGKEGEPSMLSEKGGMFKGCYRGLKIRKESKPSATVHECNKGLTRCVL